MATPQQFRRLLDGFDQAKSALEKITPAFLAGLSDEDFAYVVKTTANYFNSLRSACNYLDHLDCMRERRKV